MESWRGRGRRLGRDALTWLVTTWKAADHGHDRTDGTGGDGKSHADSGNQANMMDDAGRTDSDTGTRDDRASGPDQELADPDLTAEEDRVARGEGVREQIERGAEIRDQNRRAMAQGGRVWTPEQAVVAMPERRASRPEHNRVPSWLQTGAAWSWRLLLLAAAIYLVIRLLGLLYIVVVPCTAALLLTALLQPLQARLRRAGLHPLAATWCTLLIAAAVFGGLIMLVADRVSADYSELVAEVKHTTTQVQSWLAGPPLHLKGNSVQNALNDIPSYLSKHQSLVEGTVLTGGKIASEFLAGLVLMLFVTFFLIKDGERIWAWLLGAMRTDTARRMDRAGHAAWLAVVYYMRGTVAVAAIHAVIIGLALWIMRVPLALPLAVLVFLAAFVPLVGLLAAGGLAILVTLAAKGWLDAVILLCVLVVEDQLEAHLLQPQVVGRVIRLHPLAVILALAAGGVLAGIPGAVVAVPVVAVITRALPELRRREPGDPVPDDPVPDDP
jgi:predicted PurR-regulated permease PerM